jgi:hypothetical protein
MSILRDKQRNAANAPPMNLQKIFSAMAYDLKVSTNPQVLNASSLLANGKYLRFVKTLDDMTSQMYTSLADEKFRLHQLAALFSKFPFQDPSINREDIAISKFLKTERKCKRMNQKFLARRSRMEPPHMNFMREWIRSVIGDVIPYDEIYSNCDFGPGSSVGVHGANTTFVRKLRKLTCTPSAAPVALTALRSNIHYRDIVSVDTGVLVPIPHSDVSEWAKIYDFSGVQVEYVQYNKITCVPKNAKTDRTIAIEPTLNGFLQTGVDRFYKKRLRRIGVDLSSQALNKALARIGSLYGCYSTIDLSSASDSMSVQLIKELLPADWFSFLDAIRSPSYSLDNKTPVRYEKFCSMGNGFCFPLETLIFRAAVEYVMSVCSIHPNRTCAVYGDDIIVPYECALLLIEVLRDLGFSPNTDKTFVIGEFKESCGADYFCGVNVRPVFIKKPLKGNHDCYPLLNALRKRKLFHTWQTVLDLLPGRWRYFRPYERDDDTAIDVSLDVFMSSKHAMWNRTTHSWNWKKVVQHQPIGVKPISDEELLAGKLRGDLILSDLFTFRFGESTRIQVGT